MQKSIRCPGCDVELTLPSVADGQIVQCARCVHVFEFWRQAAGARVAPASVHPSNSRPEIKDDSAEDEPIFDQRLLHSEPLRAKWKAAVTMAFLAANVLSFAALAYVAFEFTHLLRTEKELGGPPHFFFLGLPGPVNPRLPGPVNPRLAEVEQQLDDWRGVATGGVSLQFLLCLPTAVFFLAWLSQASANLRGLNVDGLSHTPSGAVTAFFFPVVNFLRPYLIVQQIWRASDPRAIRTPDSWKANPYGALVASWWFLWLLAVACAVIAQFAMTTDPPFGEHRESLTSAWLGCLSCLCAAAAAALLVAIIHKVQQRQQERSRRLYEDPA